MKRNIIIIPFLVVSLVIAGFVNIPLTGVAADDGMFDMCNNVVNALGINNGIQKTITEPVSRSEFAAMTVRLLNIGDLGYTDYYTDVDETTSFANEISAAKKLGIAGGVSEVEFAPLQSVTHAQAAKMIVCALGLDQSAKVGGGYPYGYIKVAENLDITDGIAFAWDAELSYGDAVILIYNALLSTYIDVEKVTLDNPDSILYYKESNMTVLERYFNYHIVEGVVWTAGKSSMHLSGGEDGLLEVDGEKLKYSGSDITDYIGLDVMALTDRNDKVLVVVPTTKNNVYTVSADDVIEISDSKVEYFAGDDEKKITLDSAYTLMRNWKASAGTNMDIEDGKLILIDNTGDKKADVVHIQKAETLIISNVSGNNVSDKYSGITMTLPDEVAIVKGDDKVYVSPEELLANMVVSVYLDDNGNVSQAIAGYDLIHGAVVTETDNEKLIIDGEEYELSAYFKKYFGFKPEIGSRVTAYFDYTGKICYLEKFISKNTSGMSYGYLIGTKFGGSFGEVLLNILTSDGTVRAFNVKDKITFDGVSSVASNSDTVKSALTRDGSKVKYGLIKYSVNADDIITRIDTAEYRSSTNFAEKYAPTSWDSDNSLTLFVKGGKVMCRSAGNLHPYCIYSNPIVFEVPTALATQPDVDYDESLFNVRTKSFENNGKYTVDLYDYDSGFAPAVIVNYGNAGSGVKPMDVDMENDPIAFVTDVSRVMDDDGNETIGLSLLQSGQRLTKRLSSNILPYFEEKNLVPGKGDIIQYATDGLGDIAGITLFDYDAETGIFNIDYSKTGDGIVDDTTFIAGKAYSVSAKHIAIVASTKPGPFSGVDHPDKEFILLLRNSVTFVKCNIAEDEFDLGSVGDIATIESVGEANASDIIIQLDWGVPVMVGIYN